MKFVMDQQRIKLGLFVEKQPIAPRDVCFVYRNDRGDMLQIREGERLTRGELKAGKFTSLIKIDMSPKFFTYEDEFQAMDQGDSFEIESTVTVQVDDPVLVLRNGEKNSRLLLEKQLKYEISDLAKKYGIQHYDGLKFDIESLINDVKFNREMENIGFRVIDIKTSVDLSEKSRKHFEELTRIEKEKEYVKKKIEAEEEIESMKDDLDHKKKMRTMDNVGELISMYGPDGYRIATAKTDEERAAIIQELQAKKDKEDREIRNKIERWQDEGMTDEEIEKRLKLEYKYTSSYGNTYIPTLPAKEPERIGETAEEKKDTKLLEELDKLVKESEKGE